MKRNSKIALGFLLVSVILWIITIVTDFVIVLFIGAILSTIICICFGVICIVNKISDNKSPYFVFGITDVIIGILVTIYSFCDMYFNRKELFGGFLGLVLLLFVIPCSFVLFVIDILLWIKNCRWKGKH